MIELDSGDLKLIVKMLEQLDSFAKEDARRNTLNYLGLNKFVSQIDFSGDARKAVGVIITSLQAAGYIEEKSKQKANDINKEYTALGLFLEGLISEHFVGEQEKRDIGEIIQKYELVSPSGLVKIVAIKELLDALPPNIVWSENDLRLAYRESGCRLAQEVYGLEQLLKNLRYWPRGEKIGGMFKLHPLFKFCCWLAKLNPKVEVPIQEWMDAYAVKEGMHKQANEYLTEIKKTAISSKEENLPSSILTIKLEPVPESSNFLLTITITPEQRPTEVIVQTDDSRGKSLAELSKSLVGQLSKIGSYGTLLVEAFVPLEAIYQMLDKDNSELRIENWEVTSNPLKGRIHSEILKVRNYIVYRSYERIDPHIDSDDHNLMLNRWQEKWQQLQKWHNEAHTFSNAFFVCKDPRNQICKDLQLALVQEGVVGIGVHKPALKIDANKLELLWEAYNQGIPIALWIWDELTDPNQIRSLQDFYAPYEDEDASSPHNLPQKIRKLWKDAGKAGKGHYGENLAILWDDPGSLPKELSYQNSNTDYYSEPELMAG